MTTPTPPTTKIVIVSGQEFSVPVETENEQIRQQLAAMGFADVASATIQTGKKTIDGVEYETIEFVKKAGTKGMESAEFAALLSTVPRAPLTAKGAMSRSARATLQRLADASLTYGEALEDVATIGEALNAVIQGERVKSEGGEVCAHLDRLPAVSALAPSAW